VLKSLDEYKPRSKAVRYVLGYLVLFLGTILAKIEIKGRQNIPRKEPFVIAVNHFHRIDPPFIIFAIQKPINFLMASDQNVEAKLMWGPWLYGFISTNRKKVAPSTIKRSIKAIERGEIIGLFPEGAATEKQLRPPKKGAIYFAIKTNVPILPVSIIGLENVSKNWFRGIRPRIKIKIGKAYKIDLAGKNGKDDRENQIISLGEDMMCRIAALLPERNHGAFIGDKRIELYKNLN
jgi:1-acyl-sn-glycerol-3-phosphate acyltransferase